MARIGSTGVLELWYAATVTDKAAPAVGDLTSGINLTPFLTRDGLDTPLSGSTMDVAGVDSRYNSTARGSYGGDPVTVTCFRDSDADIAYETLTPETDGYLLVFRFGLAAEGVPAAGDMAEVWPIEVISRAPLSIADNQAQRFTSQCSVPTPPVTDAVPLVA